MGGCEGAISDSRLIINLESFTYAWAHIDMNNKRPPAKKISRDAVVKDCDAILRMSVIFAVLGACRIFSARQAIA